jgi:hypothetical protein
MTGSQGRRLSDFAILRPVSIVAKSTVTRRSALGVRHREARQRRGDLNQAPVIARRGSAVAIHRLLIDQRCLDCHGLTASQ